jgi:hypothetical protein
MQAARAQIRLDKRPAGLHGGLVHPFHGVAVKIAARNRPPNYRMQICKYEIGLGWSTAFHYGIDSAVDISAVQIR